MWILPRESERVEQVARVTQLPGASCVNILDGVALDYAANVSGHIPMEAEVASDFVGALRTRCGHLLLH